MQKCAFLLPLFLLTAFYRLSAQRPDDDRDRQKTAFQTASGWMPQIDIRSDVAIIYGVNGNPSDRRHKGAFTDRVKSWQDRGYATHFMTGIAWGAYQDYFYGGWDGKTHLDEAQVAIHHDTVWHGGGIPYIVPVQSYIDYFKKAVVEKVIDAGITSLFFEEPEFWARSGYSDAFKSAWKKYYGFDWRPQDQSPENTYLSNKLKYHLYYQALKEVSAYAKSYGKRRGLAVKVYIPTHSLVNYSSWQIVSPEASLASLPGIDGYIAQVWTGTAREPTYFDGVKKERVFENAFLEYGSMVSMTAPTGRKVFFLTDPIEDRARDWGDYKRNYEATFTAELLYPTVNDYEVMPWPERIFTRPYRLPDRDTSVLIPHYYSTQILIMINALNDMPVSENRVNGTGGFGVLMSNSLMFQRFPTHQSYEDPQFSNFYGQTFPLLKRGVPVETVHAENLSYPGALKNIKVLVMSYSNMKPLSPEVHERLARWVGQGGVLIYCGRDDDPYQTVLEWWNTKGNHFPAPVDHLFGLLHIKPELADDRVQAFKAGSGRVYVIRQDPKEFVMNKGGDSVYVAILEKAYQTDAHAGKIDWKNNLFLQRGPYDMVSVMDENADRSPFTIAGPVIDLFDPELPVLSEKVVQPGRQAFLYDLKRENSSRPKVLASASRIYEEKRAEKRYSFLCKSPANTVNSMRVLLPAAPKTFTIEDAGGNKVEILKESWDEKSKTWYVSFPNNPEGIRVEAGW